MKQEEHNKKRGELNELEGKLIEKAAAECPIGSYETENKVAECCGDDSCRELCKTCINHTK